MHCDFYSLYIPTVIIWYFNLMAVEVGTHSDVSEEFLMRAMYTMCLLGEIG